MSDHFDDEKERWPDERLCLTLVVAFILGWHWRYSFGGWSANGCMQKKVLQPANRRAILTQTIVGIFISLLLVIVGGEQNEGEALMPRDDGWSTLMKKLDNKPCPLRSCG